MLFRSDVLGMTAIVVSPDGARRARATAVSDRHRPDEFGREMAEGLAREGAVAILDEVR